MDDIEINYNVNGCFDTDVSDASYQWYLDSINIPQSSYHNSDDKVKVELLDSGVSYVSSLENVNHIDLTDEEVNLLYNDNNGHGTALAGIICADPNSGDITGINPNVDLYSVKVLDHNLQAPISKIIEGIYWGIENDIDIINMSFGTTVYSETLHNAIKDAKNSGILLIASAGNNVEEGVLYPAAFQEVIAVGSTDNNGELVSDYANGDKVEVLAPGTKIISTGIWDGFISGSGTSLSTAQITGVASRLLEAEGANADNVRELLKITGKTVENTNAKLVDYEYASSCQNEFFDDFMNGETDDCKYNNDGVIETYGTDTIVNGMWYNDTHEFLVNNSNNYNEENNGISLSTEHLRCVLYGAKNSDAFKKIYQEEYYTEYSDGDPEEYKGLHGLGAYSINVKALWKYANYIGAGKTTTEAYDSTWSFLTAAERKALWKVEYPNSNLDEVPVKYKTGGVLRTAGAFLRWVKHNKPELRNTDLKEKYLVIGLLFHLVGDIYAHRTLVPAYTFENAKNNATNYASGNSSDFASYLVKTDFSWDSFYNKYSDGTTLTFVSITGKITNQDYKGDTSRYEDNPKFCRERLNAALRSSRKLLREVITDVDPNGNVIHQQKNVSLRYFSEYNARLSENS